MSWNGMEKDFTGIERSQGMAWAREEREVPLSEQRSLGVAIIEAPNAVMLNHLPQQKVCLQVSTNLISRC